MTTIIDNTVDFKMSVFLMFFSLELILFWVSGFIAYLTVIYFGKYYKHIENIIKLIQNYKYLSLYIYYYYFKMRIKYVLITDQIFIFYVKFIKAIDWDGDSLYLNLIQKLRVCSELDSI